MGVLVRDCYVPLQHFKCHYSQSREMPLFLSLAGKKMQQCSLEAEEVKKRLAFPTPCFTVTSLLFAAVYFPHKQQFLGILGLLSCSSGCLFHPTPGQPHVISAREGWELWSRSGCSSGAGRPGRAVGMGKDAGRDGLHCGSVSLWGRESLWCLWWDAGRGMSLRTDSSQGRCSCSETGAAGAQSGSNCPLIKARGGRGAGVGGCGSLALAAALTPVCVCIYIINVIIVRKMLEL